MKLTILTLALFSIALGAPADKKAAAKGAPAPTGVVIPKDATKNPDGTFSWTDKDGTKWLYAKTPFGVMKSPANPSAPEGGSSVAGATLQNTRVTDKGDSVKFERTTPFGPMIWEKKKTELTPDEKTILDYHTAKPSDANAH